MPSKVCGLTRHEARDKKQLRRKFIARASTLTSVKDRGVKEIEMQIKLPLRKTLKILCVIQLAQTKHIDARTFIFARATFDFHTPTSAAVAELLSSKFALGTHVYRKTAKP